MHTKERALQMGPRLKFALIIGGGILGFLGFQEYRVGKGASVKPVPASLARLEGGGLLPNVHVKLGQHFCVYPASVYNCQVKTGETTPPPDAKLNFVYFPIISTGHPWCQQAKRVIMRHGGRVNAVPPNEWPPLDQFAVLVKTSKRFKTLDKIPREWVLGEEVTGLVVNRIKKLSSKERELVQQAFPKADLNSILILEEGRSPKSETTSLAMAGGGVFLAFIGLVGLATGSRR
jgi:hypothetical protein